MWKTEGKDWWSGHDVGATISALCITRTEIDSVPYCQTLITRGSVAVRLRQDAGPTTRKEELVSPYCSGKEVSFGCIDLAFILFLACAYLGDLDLHHCQSIFKRNACSMSQQLDVNIGAIARRIRSFGRIPFKLTPVSIAVTTTRAGINEVLG